VLRRHAVTALNQNLMAFALLLSSLLLNLSQHSLNDGKPRPNPATPRGHNHLTFHSGHAKHLLLTVYDKMLSLGRIDTRRFLH